MKPDHHNELGTLEFKQTGNDYCEGCVGRNDRLMCQRLPKCWIGSYAEADCNGTHGVWMLKEVKP